MATATALAVTTSAAAVVPTIDLDEFIRTERKYLFKVCMGFMKNPEDAEDMVQKICIKLYTKLHTFKGTAAFKTWATTIARNVCLMEIRDRRSEHRVMNTEVELTEDDLRIHAKKAVVLPQEYTGSGKREVLWLEAINLLAPSYRRVIIGHILEEKPYYQLAAEFGLTLGAVKSYGGRGCNILNSIVMSDSRFAVIRSTKPLSVSMACSFGGQRRPVHLVAQRNSFNTAGTTKRKNISRLAPKG